MNLPIFKTAHNLALVSRQSRVDIQARIRKKPGRTWQNKPEE